jgi:stalled ribosome rescue protein Dom34
VTTESATGSVNASKVRTTLTIQVEAIDFDTQACVLRVKGRNVCENQYVKVSKLVKVFFRHWKIHCTKKKKKMF